MRVELLGYTAPMNTDTSVEVFTAACAKGCYSEQPSFEIIDNLSCDSASKTLAHIVGSGHGSVVEHLNFTFSIEGISRVCSHQLVRHRMGSYSQQSQRYVRFEDVEMVTPPTVQAAIDNVPAEDNYVEETLDYYYESLGALTEVLRNAGVPEEDIRYYYPNGSLTNITVTMNARSLLNFFTWRCCGQAQWEIRELANRMLDICKKVAPTIFKDAGPECRRTGCREGKRSCSMRH